MERQTVASRGDAEGGMPRQRSLTANAPNAPNAPGAGRPRDESRFTRQIFLTRSPLLIRPRGHVADIVVREEPHVRPAHRVGIGFTGPTIGVVVAVRRRLRVLATVRRRHAQQTIAKSSNCPDLWADLCGSVNSS